MALYKNLVRPHLEYCTKMWRPYLIKDIKLLEVVRRCSAEGHQVDIGYSIDRLKRSFGTLENRRLRSDLIETYKILNGNYSISRELFF